MTPLATDFVTILRCAQGKSATKAIHPGKDGPIIGDYNAGLWFSVDMAPVDGIESLAGVLDRTSEDARAFVIRGEPLPDTDLECCRRLLHPQPDGTPPTFREEPRRWALLDVDTVPWPPRGREFLWNWSTGPLSGTYLRSLLPVEFHSVSFWWQFTSGAGFKPGLRMRLAFWLSRALTGNELARWLAAAPVDHAVFRPVQAIYVAKPQLFQVPDPVPERSGLEWGFSDAVEVPELPAEEREPEGDLDFNCDDGWREQPAAAYGWPYAVLQEVAESIVGTPPAGVNRWGGGGRHHALFCGALRVSGLIEKRFLDEAGAVRTLAAAARRAGISDAEGARTIRNAFRRGGLAA